MPTYYDTTSWTTSTFGSAHNDNLGSNQNGRVINVTGNKSTGLQYVPGARLYDANDDTLIHDSDTDDLSLTTTDRLTTSGGNRVVSEVGLYELSTITYVNGWGVTKTITLPLYVIETQSSQMDILYTSTQLGLLPDDFSGNNVTSITLGTFSGREFSFIGGYSFEHPDPVATIPCFTTGTMIDTPTGRVAIETLKAGDLVLTCDHGPQPIRWIGSRKVSSIGLEVNPKLRPVVIFKGALGAGLPERTMKVSRQHRMLVDSTIARRMFGQNEVLIPAIKLTDLSGIYVSEDDLEVEYFHMLFDQHEIVIAEGAPSESLFTGPEALKAVSLEARTEIETLFPEIAKPNYIPKPARHIPAKGMQIKKLVERHRENAKPVLTQHWMKPSEKQRVNRPA